MKEEKDSEKLERAQGLDGWKDGKRARLAITKLSLQASLILCSGFQPRRELGQPALTPREGS